MMDFLIWDSTRSYILYRFVGKLTMTVATQPQACSEWSFSTSMNGPNYPDSEAFTIAVFSIRTKDENSNAIPP